MGEAFLVKSLGYAEADPLDNVTIVSGYASLLVTVMDSGGNKLINHPVHCKDGNTWYNYNTNDQGMVLFQCNSGMANLVAWNYSIIDKYNVIDQTPATMNVDAPVATKNHLKMNLGKINSDVLTISSNVNARFLVTNMLNKVQIIGGGGWGGGKAVETGNIYDDGIYGGGGGAYNESTQVQLDRSTTYPITIGIFAAAKGGETYTLCPANTGGTTSAFDLSAVGGSGRNAGGSGSYRGGNGGIPYTNMNFCNQNFPSNSKGLNANYANINFPYGGGGGGFNVGGIYFPTTAFNLMTGNMSYSGMGAPYYITYAQRYSNGTLTSNYGITPGIVNGNYGGGSCGTKVGCNGVVFITF